MQADSGFPRAAVRSVCVLGGGTAGYFAAIALKRTFPSLEVRVVESSRIPIIGVGEATTPLVMPFLHTLLGIDPEELFREVRPTFKLGIRFEWGHPGDYYFTYPFGETDLVSSYANDGDIRTQSLTSVLIGTGGSPLFRTEDGALRSTMDVMRYAYHLDNEPFVALLQKVAARVGILRDENVIQEVVRRNEGDGIALLRGEDGREYHADLFVDASGFRSQILGETLGTPFQSWAGSLFCDTAVVAEVPHHGVIRPCTTARSMNAGWLWQIPVMGEDHHGYVHASAFLPLDKAIDEMRAVDPEMGDARIVRFRSGRHASFWRGNVIGMGNAFGFVEPLESTALHMLIVEIGYLLGMLSTTDGEPQDWAWMSDRIGRHWDYLRWFLAVHYRFNHRLDTEFWRACRADADVSGLQPMLDRFAAQGPWERDEGAVHDVDDPTFGYQGLMLLLLGQKAPSPPVRPRVQPVRWAERVRRMRAWSARSLSHAEALSTLHASPELLRIMLDSPHTWVTPSARSLIVTRDGGSVYEQNLWQPRELDDLDALILSQD